jgi:hypothetical protein
VDRWHYRPRKLRDEWSLEGTGREDNSARVDRTVASSQDESGLTILLLEGKNLGVLAHRCLRGPSIFLDDPGDLAVVREAVQVVT